MKILCLGDIVGKVGRDIVIDYLTRNSEKYDFVIVNGENSAAGFGITAKIADELIEAGVDIITTGNHIWNQRDIYEYLNHSKKLIRPYNYSKSCPGKGIAYAKTKKGKRLAVINMQGNVFMPNADNPFLKIEEALQEIGDYSKIIILDFHAEATSEKRALGWFLDGKISLMYGTHTHVITADEEILPKGTGYITDIGMCGSYESIIGMKKDNIINKFINGMPSKYEVASENPKISGIEFEIDENGKCSKIDKLILSRKEFM